MWDGWTTRLPRPQGRRVDSARDSEAGDAESCLSRRTGSRLFAARRSEPSRPPISSSREGPRLLAVLGSWDVASGRGLVARLRPGDRGASPLRPSLNLWLDVTADHERALVSAAGRYETAQAEPARALPRGVSSTRGALDASSLEEALLSSARPVAAAGAKSVVLSGRGWAVSPPSRRPRRRLRPAREAPGRGEATVFSLDVTAADRTPVVGRQPCAADTGGSTRGPTSSGNPLGAKRGAARPYILAFPRPKGSAAP